MGFDLISIQLYAMLALVIILPIIGGGIALIIYFIFKGSTKDHINNKLSIEKYAGFWRRFEASIVDCQRRREDAIKVAV